MKAGFHFDLEGIRAALIDVVERECPLEEPRHYTATAEFTEDGGLKSAFVHECACEMGADGEPNEKLQAEIREATTEAISELVARMFAGKEDFEGAVATNLDTGETLYFGPDGERTEAPGVIEEGADEPALH